MTIKERVYFDVQYRQERGLTVPEYLAAYPTLLPQTVYPCFTQLCKSKKILASGVYRKSNSKRRSIVWVDAKYGGTVPVWGSSQPSYGYRNRAKVVMDLLAGFGPLSVAEMMTSCSSLKPMSTSSLVSRLVKQQWLYKTNRTRLNDLHQTCCLYGLTPRGKQVIDASPRRKSGTFACPPVVLKETEKTR